MSAFKGRNVLLEWDNEPVAGVRTKNSSVAAEPVDITDDDSSGWAEKLDEAGQMEVTVSLAGLTKSDKLKIDSKSITNRIKPLSLTYPDGGVLSGNFFFATYSEGIEYNDAVSFDAEFQSSGVVTYTPATT